VKRVLESLNLKVEPRIGKGKMGPIITDNGNMLADVYAGRIEDPESLDERLRRVAGILETGIFPKLANLIVIGYPDGAVKRMEVSRRATP